MLSKLHQQDIRELSKQASNNPLTEYWAIRLGDRYGYKSAYTYLDMFIKPNKTRREKIKEQSYKLLTKINNHLKQWINDKRRISI